MAQTSPPAPAERKDYVSLMAGGDYAGALKILLPRIEEINGTRVDEKRVPSDFITLGGGENEGLSKNKQLNRLFRERTERTRLAMVRSKPLPFPPGPARQLVIDMTRRSLAKADEQGGRRDLWLRTLDRLGLGFDS